MGHEMRKISIASEKDILYCLDMIKKAVQDSPKIISCQLDTSSSLHGTSQISFSVQLAHPIEKENPDVE